MNRLSAIFLVLFLITVAFAATLGYEFEIKATSTSTSVKTTTITTSNKVKLVTVTEQVIQVVSPQTATLTIQVIGNCTIALPTFILLYSNTTEFILSSGNLNSTFSIVSTVTSFSQMPSQETTYTTTTESGNIEVNTTITQENTTVVTSTCPATTYA